MIPRYTRPEMAAIWAPEHRLRLWLEIELCALEAMAAIDQVPRAVAANVRAAAERHGAALVDPRRIEEIEAETRHDVIAFLTHVEQVIGPEARYLHLGMTSSDLLDTALALQLTAAADLLLADLDRVLEALGRRAHEHKHTLCIGRSHGVHAEPTTFGLKLAGFYAEFARNRRRLEQARGEVATCAISGAVGTFANVDPRVEEQVASRLCLTPEPISTQVIPRDRHAAFFATLAVIASGIERLATEIRHLQRTEVGEVAEPFAAGQKGSSAMPHKQNPILAENLTGLARLVRAAVVPALEDVALWHERDISHSSVERVIAPDATIALDFALHRLARLIEGMRVDPARMRANLEQTKGLIHSQRVLLALTEAGLGRQEAYAIVQRHALEAWRRGQPLLDRLRAEPEVTKRLLPEQLSGLFDLGYHTRHVDTIFSRVFGE
ncbi:MAG TPA: adenylosuccinate lyase [Geminicoccaceae bacterium]|jgi:adenylosuccinate lyase|nr:adenylosuccinate lyase [Geminicoccaceae bacterium]